MFSQVRKWYADLTWGKPRLDLAFKVAGLLLLCSGAYYHATTNRWVLFATDLPFIAGFGWLVFDWFVDASLKK